MEINYDAFDMKVVHPGYLLKEAMKRVASYFANNSVTKNGKWR